jgi:hypothetical protein
MQRKWMNEAQTILQVQTGPNAWRIVEAGMSDFLALASQPDIEPFEPEPIYLRQLQVMATRQEAFTREADPLFFKWQAGEGTQEEWEAKRSEIRARYPYPESTK